jgi:predicted permease
VAVLLGIACVNVAVLLLGEAVTRQHEMATRRALGASAWRLVRQTLTESLVVGLAGGVVGLAVGAWGTRGLVALAPPSIPGLADVSMNLRVLGFALCIAIITGVLFGLAPALLSSGTAPALLLRAGMGQSRRRRGALQRILVAAELALSVVLLVGAGLLGRSFEKVTAVDPGFRTEHLLVARVALPRAVVGDTARVTRFYTGLVAELRALPGVTGATLGTQPPFSGGWSSTMIRREGEPDSVGHETQQRIVVPGYFATLGIPLLAGRDFSAADRGDTPEVAIVSEALARRDFPTESPLGKRVLFHDRWRTIVGVVGDVHLQKLSRVLEPSIYTPAAQNGTATMEALVRTAGDPSKLTGTVRATVRRTEPRAALWTLDQMSDLMERSFADERYRTMLIALFGVVAVILAAVGMYGVTARAAARRQHEIGIRLALGATSGSVVRLVIGQTLAGVAVGVAIGLLGAFATGPLLSPFLFGVHAMDAVTYTGIVAFLVCVSLTASWLPARRAGRRELAEVLREE